MRSAPVRDFAAVETIYRRSIRTVKLKISLDYIRSRDMELQTISNPDDVYTILQAVFATLDDDQEHLVLLILNVANDVIGYKVIASGGQDAARIDSKVIFRNALLLGAVNIIIAHNHPSGNLEPSKQDLALTRKVAEGARLLDIELLDHVILSMRGYISLKSMRPEIWNDRSLNK
jgi:DNA repair protein RadC